jgi:hypothetical protein
MLYLMTSLCDFKALINRHSLAQRGDSLDVLISGFVHLPVTQKAAIKRIFASELLFWV